MNALTLATPPAPSVAAPAEYLSFHLGAEEYGIDILKVQEIRSYEAPTALPNAPAVLRGVIDLRGVITPVVDLRLAFGQMDAVCTPLTVIIVLNLGARVIGVVVDSVSDVIDLGADDIRPAPRLRTVVLDTRCITGIGTVAERMLILLDIERLMETPALGLGHALRHAA